MNKDVIAFDLSDCVRSAGAIRAESEKLRRMADKLKRSMVEAPSWWVGDSRNSFLRRANALLTMMYALADRVLEMSERVSATGEYRKEEEERLARELRKLAGHNTRADTPYR